MNHYYYIWYNLMHRYLKRASSPTRVYDKVSSNDKLPVVKTQAYTLTCFFIRMLTLPAYLQLGQCWNPTVNAN